MATNLCATIRQLTLLPRMGTSTTKESRNCSLSDVGHSHGQQAKNLWRVCATPEQQELTLRDEEPRGRYAAYDFMERVRTEGASIEDLQAIAPRYQRAYLEYVDDLTEKADKEKIALLEELRTAERNLFEMKEEVASQLHFTADLVNQLERQHHNLGLRVVIETILRRFNVMHMNGECQDVKCQSYISNLLQQNVIGKQGRPVKVTSNTGGPPQFYQRYTFKTQEWSKVDTIKHLAECPKMMLTNQYLDATGNLLLSMPAADLQSEVEQRAKVIWDQLHAPHHILDASTSSITLKLPYGPSRNRADTLFYLTACQAAKIGVEVVLEEVPGDIAVALRDLAEAVRNRK